MASKEEIWLSKPRSGYYGNDECMEKEPTFQSMDEWAKIKAIEFAEWCGENSIGYEESIWFYKDKTGRYNSNTEEMYTLYNQSLK